MGVTSYYRFHSWVSSKSELKLQLNTLQVASRNTHFLKDLHLHSTVFTFVSYRICIICICILLNQILHSTEFALETKLICICILQNSHFHTKEFTFYKICIWAVTCYSQQCGILTSVDSDEPVQPPVKLRNSKCCTVSSLTLIEYSSDRQRLWSDCVYAQADLRLCWSIIRHC